MNNFRAPWKPADPDDPVANQLRESCVMFLQNANFQALLPRDSTWPFDMDALRIYRADVDRPVNEIPEQNINCPLRYVWYKATPAWMDTQSWTVRMDHFIPHLPPKAFDSDRIYAILQNALTKEHSSDQKPVTLFTTNDLLPCGLSQIRRYNYANDQITEYHNQLEFLGPLVTSDIASSKPTITESLLPGAGYHSMQPPNQPAGSPVGNGVPAAASLPDPFVSGSGDLTSPPRSINGVGGVAAHENIDSLEQRAQQILPRVEDPHVATLIHGLLGELSNKCEQVKALCQENQELHRQQHSQVG